MSYAGGLSYLAIPGPSVMPDRVLRAMHRPAPNIYEGELVEMVGTILPDLKYVAQTEQYATIYVGNGHAAWEASLSNVVAPGEKVLSVTTGYFGNGWADMAAGIGAEVETLDFGRKGPYDPNKVEEVLRADKDHAIKAILTTHVDTATGVLNPLQEMRAAIDAAGHPALLMADCIASMGCDRFEMDNWGVDVAITSSQKGLMVPPGLSFIFFSERAKAKREGMERVSRYWDWKPRSDPAKFSMLFCGTAPTHHLYGLRAALDLIKEEGLENVWTRHERNARTVWAACDAWAEGGALSFNINDVANRSRAVTALRVGLPYGPQLRSWTDRNMGLVLGIGINNPEPGDDMGRGHFRIGHMGHLNGHMIMGALGSIEAAFQAIQMPHGQGALAAAAGVQAEGAEPDIAPKAPSVQL